MDLFILRHGEADKSSDGDDFVRPLTVEGTTDVKRVAEWLNDLGVEGTLKRAQQSASIVSKIFNIENNLMNWEELQPGRNRIEFYRKLSSEQLFKQESVVLVVGHAPYLSSLISDIISEANASSHVVLKKAGLAKIRITSQYAQTMHGELEWLLTPKLMKNISK
ncbi:MAG: phosphohistidine phosphatase SixA [Candidatus Nitrosopolaris sp.]